MPDVLPGDGSLTRSLQGTAGVVQRVRAIVLPTKGIQALCGIDSGWDCFHLPAEDHLYVVGPRVRRLCIRSSEVSEDHCICVQSMIY